MGDVSVVTKVEESINLPPGFRFHPTDEEIITHYLSRKVMNHNFSSLAVGEVDLNKCEPWDLPSKAKMGEKEWYFFCQRDRKYPTGMRTNRATESGYWKATGKDKEIYRGRGILVGMKKTLVFYRGRAPKGEKTNWVMHEFRLEGYQNFPKSSKDEWVVCRVFHKNMGVKKSPTPPGLARMNSLGDHDLLDSPNLPPLMDPLYFNPNSKPSSSYINYGGNQGFNLKAIPPSSTSMSSYLSTMMGTENPQDNSKSFFPNSYTTMNNQINPSSMFNPQIPPPVPHVTLPGSSGNLGYLHQDQAILRALASTDDGSNALRGHCKVEQLSNHSMVSASQDTGLSTDRNTETSSVMSKHEIGSFDDLDSSAGPVIDLENLWKY